MVSAGGEAFGAQSPRRRRKASPECWGFARHCPASTQHHPGVYNNLGAVPAASEGRVSIWKRYAINQPFWDVLCSPAGPKRLAGNGVANGVISARAWILWIIGKNPRTFHKKFLSKSLIEWGDVTFHYDFHQIREILIFCIGNPIVNLIGFIDFEDLVVFFQEKFYIGNSIVNFLIPWQSENYLGKSRFLIEFFMESPWVFSYDPEIACCF